MANTPRPSRRHEIFSTNRHKDLPQYLNWLLCKRPKMSISNTRSPIAGEGQMSTEELFAQYDQRRAEQRSRESALIAQAPATFSHVVQQQGPEAGYNFLVGLYNGTVTRFPSQPQHSMPAYGYQAQPQYPMLAYGHQEQPQHLMPAYGHPASAFPTAQQHGLQAAEMQDTTPQPPTGARRRRGPVE